MSFLFIVALLVVGWILYSQYLTKLLAQGQAGKIKLALIAIGLIFLLLAITGRAHALFAIIGAALTQVMRIAPLLIRYAPFLKRFIGFSSDTRANAKQTSTVTTATIAMTLDHGTGGVAGEILAGEFIGRTLDSLSMIELRSLYSYCNEHDPEAARLLMTFIARERAEHWQDAEPSGDKHHSESSEQISGEMSVKEARQVLGIEGELSRESIVSAHRQLIGQFHPDKGGNDYIAAKINAARAVLIKHV